MSDKESYTDEMWKPAESDSQEPWDPYIEDEIDADFIDEDLNKRDIPTEQEIDEERLQSELDRKFKEEHFDLLYEEYYDKFQFYIFVIDQIISDVSNSIEEKYDKLVEVGIEIETEAMLNICKIDPITRELETLRQEALNCLAVYITDGDCYPSKYYFKGESDVEWLLKNCIVDKRDYRTQQQQLFYHQITAKQLIASKYYLQGSLNNLKENKVKKVSKSTKITSYSLAITTHLFELIRNENIITSSNVKLSESIANLTGFSKKQAVNQFSENAKKENASKLNAQTKALLEKLLKRLE